LANATPSKKESLAGLNLTDGRAVFYRERREGDGSFSDFLKVHGGGAQLGIKAKRESKRKFMPNESGGAKKEIENT